MQHLRYAELHDYTLQSLTQRAVVPNKGNQSSATAHLCCSKYLRGHRLSWISKLPLTTDYYLLQTGGSIETYNNAICVVICILNGPCIFPVRSPYMRKKYGFRE